MYAGIHKKNVGKLTDARAREQGKWIFPARLRSYAELNQTQA